MIHNLHLLRGVAALMVVMHHALFVLFRNGHIEYHPGIGALGVDLFFVISGFVIVISTKPETSPNEFLRRRFLRVVPLYWLVTLVVSGLYVLDAFAGDSSNLPTLSELTQSLLFIPYEAVDGRAMPVLLVGWTLYFEVFFYLVFFVCLSIFKRDRVILAAGLCLAGLAALWAVVPSTAVALKFYSNPVILEFIWGMMLAVMWQNRRSWFSKIDTPILYLGILSGIALLFLSGKEHNPFLAGIGAALIIGSALAFEDRGQVVRSQVSTFFGNISYSLYLIHFTYFFIAEAILNRMGIMNSLPAVLIGLGIAFIGACYLAWMSFRLIETPLARLARSPARQTAKG